MPKTYSLRVRAQAVVFVRPSSTRFRLVTRSVWLKTVSSTKTG